MYYVIIIDDEDVLLDLLRELVEELGYCSITALNGKEAWDTLQSLTELPVVIITDRMMPYMNGVDFIERVRSRPRFKYIPIILMSAAGAGGKTVTADVFVQKPFDINELANLIEYIVNS